MTIKGNIVDIFAQRVYCGELVVENGKISDIIESGAENPELDYIMPGFVDAHVHTESSMLMPDEFARVAAQNGTVAAVTDPHEIANVLGIDGVKYLIANASASPFHFCFGAPSCVPSTGFETSGAVLGHVEVEQLLDLKQVTHLSEVMNVPAVLSDDADMMLKLKAAKDRNKPIDGHEAVLTGENLHRYAQNGISTNHECTELSVAKANVEAGISILIREGSAAKDYDSLHPLLDQSSDKLMFCTDDCHPDYLEQGPIRMLVKKSIAHKHNLWNVLRAACLNPVLHYKIQSGLLRRGDQADFILVDNLTEFNVLATYLGGVKYDKGNPLPVDTGKYSDSDLPNSFSHREINVSDLKISPEDPQNIKIIAITPGSLITQNKSSHATMVNGNAVSDQDRDVLKMVVINRYDMNARPAIGFVSGFKIKNGAIASSIAHDSHNIICVGTSDEHIVMAINAVIGCKGGLVCVENDKITTLPLPVAGICSAKSFGEVLEGYVCARDAARRIGAPSADAFMTMSFLALPVIPWLKLTDKGLFDFKQFNLTTL